MTEVPGSPSPLEWPALTTARHFEPPRKGGRSDELGHQPPASAKVPIAAKSDPEAGPRVLIEAHPVMAFPATWGRRSARPTAGSARWRPCCAGPLVSPHQTVEIAAGRISARASRCSPYRSLGFCSLFVLDLLHPQGTACRYANASFPPASSVEPRAASQLRRRRGLPQR